jgi:dihydroxyacid dehydratase/phosphogluconate dehydratase
MRQQACSRGPVLRGAGPIGGPEMPEWGNRPIPRRLLASHYGTSVPHVAPEAAVGRPLALLRTGDIVTLHVSAGRLDMAVDEGEPARRRAAWVRPASRYPRSCTSLYQAHVGQADQGCDFDVLAASGDVPEPAIF